jgi:uncharacterized protein YyaL (SSP411 family)
MKSNPSLLHLAVLLLLLYLPLSLKASDKSTENLIPWQPWHSDLFTQAKQDGKFILLNLEAVWCHWCHVMDQRTYSDPKIAAAIAAHYIPVKVDHDANPGLAARFRAWGWPATIVFNADGEEIVKRAGYISPDNMTALLAAIVRDPSPERQVHIENSDKVHGKLREQDRKVLIAKHKAAADPVHGGLKIPMKFLDDGSVEYALNQGYNGDKAEWQRLNRTLQGALNLQDPVWYGFYQYSTHGDWQHPHFEKIMRSQTRYIRLYTQAYMASQNEQYLRAAKNTLHYVNRFLKDDNAGYFNSQDADLIQGKKATAYFALQNNARRKLGIPRIDKNRYTNSNASMVSALAWLYRATGSAAYRDQALKTSQWLLSNRQHKNGSFFHQQETEPALFLSDNVAVIEAFLDLYEITTAPVWLRRAQNVADAIDIKLVAKLEAGVATMSQASESPLKLHVDLAENIQLARTANRLFQVGGRSQDRKLAEQALRYLVQPAIVDAQFTEPGILLADQELATEPLHLTIVGSKTDSRAQALYDKALQVVPRYRRIEWWDRNQGKLPRHDVEYPVLERSAAFVCNAKRCSAPIFKPAELLKTVRIIEGIGAT